MNKTNQSSNQAQSNLAKSANLAGASSEKRGTKSGSKGRAAQGAEVDRLNDRVSEDGLDVVLPEEASVNGVSLNPRDPNFASELEFDGYNDIEEYDNDEYSGNIDSVGDDRKELNFSGRKVADLSTGESAEESIVDPQENRKGSLDDEDLEEDEE